MPTEIERKFLVKPSWRPAGEGTLYRQGYLSLDKNRIVRIRIAGTRAFITIKGVSVGASRAEFEYEIPLEDAGFMLNNLCVKPLIEKIRHKELFAGFLWEIDEFLGDNKNLILAEIELEDENTHFNLPDWAGEEVTADQRYYNSNLAVNPFKNWETKEN